MALNTPYKRVDLNVNPNYASMAQKDPWFALGYALGEGYWNNYNARGEKKATETAEQMLNNAVKYGDPNAGILTNEDLVSKYARPDKKQQILDAAIQLPELKYDKDGKEVKGAGNQQPIIDKGLLKWGYLDDKYANNPNPVGDSVAAKKLLNNTEIALSNANMGAFDVQKFKLALDKQLMADGRNARQREAAWSAIQPMIAEKKAEHNAQVVNELYGLYEQANMNQDYENARRFAMQIGKLDPTLGKHLLSGSVTPKDIWNQSNKERMLSLRSSGKSSKGKGSGLYLNATKDGDLKLAQDIIKNPEAYTEDQVKQAKRKIDYAQRWGTEGLDLEDPLEVSKYFDYVRANSSSDLEATRILAEDGFIAKHPFAKELLREEGFYLPSDFGENGAWMSSGEADEYAPLSNEASSLPPQEDKYKLTVETPKESIVKDLAEFSRKYGINLAQYTKDKDAESR